MTRIIQLLDQKNHYLEKFYSLGEETLSILKRGGLADLDSFYRDREKILEIIRYIDSEVFDAEQSMAASITDEHRAELKDRFRVKALYTERILVQDLEVLSHIEELKSAMIKELQEVRKARKAVAGYRSRQTSHRLNEEA